MAPRRRSDVERSSAGRGRHLFVLRTLEQRRVVGGVHLERGLGGDGRGAAAAPGPGVRVEELARVVGAVAEAGPVEALVGSVHLLRRVALHEQVHRHHARSLGGEGRGGGLHKDEVMERRRCVKGGVGG